MPATSSLLSFASKCFNEAAGADPADAMSLRRRNGERRCFNEAAGADPADAFQMAMTTTERTRLQ